MSQFRINYSQVVSQANLINNLSADLKGQISRLELMENEVKANWQGQAAESFFRQINDLISNMNNTFRKIANVSTTIKYVAFRIQREDEAAATRARALEQQNKK